MVAGQTSVGNPAAFKNRSDKLEAFRRYLPM
jgi:hypothetical protein